MRGVVFQFCLVAYAIQVDIDAQGTMVPSAGASSTPSKVIFLDVDGVLHPFTANSFFQANCLAALRRIVGETGAAIVLSSSWQSSEASLAMVNRALRTNGLPTVVDKTLPSGATATSEEGRAREIARWVETHADQCSGGWVVLDDMDVQPHLPAGHVVRTRAESGLTDRDAELAVELLGGPDKSLPPLPSPPKKPGALNVSVTRGERDRDMMRAAMAGT